MIYASNALPKKIKKVFSKSQIKSMKTFVINTLLAITVEFNQSGEYVFNAKHVMILTSAKVLSYLNLDCYDKNLKIEEKFHPIDH